MAEADPYREHILHEVRSIGAQYMYLNALQNGASAKTLRKLEALGGNHGPLSSARAWRLTIEIVMRHVDQELAVRGAARAMLARLVCEMRWMDIADELHRPVERCKAIVDTATAHFYAQIVARGITEDYRDEAAA